MVILYRATAEIAEFTNGINEAGRLWETIKKYPKKFEQLFTFNPSQITCAELQELVQILWSEQGSNKLNAEDETIDCWEVFLKNVKGTV